MIAVLRRPHDMYRQPRDCMVATSALSHTPHASTGENCVATESLAPKVHRFALACWDTKSGTDEFHGEGFFFGRPSGLQARPPLADRRIPNQLLQYGGALGGPIVAGKTNFFVNYEGTRQDRGSFVDRPAPTFFLGRLREHLGLVKVDHRFSDAHTVGLRVNGSRNTNTNANDRITFLAQSSQPIQPSAAALSILQSVGVQLNDTVTLGRFINELRVSYTNAIPSASVPVTPSVVVIRPGISTEGNSAFSQVRARNVQVAEQMSLQLGAHSIRFGGNFIRQKFNDFSFQQFGTYRFGQAADPQFSQQLGVSLITYGQTRMDGFVQDDWRVNSRLTLNLGLRYDYQSIIDDYNNFGPRFGFAFDLSGDGQTVIRGGAGVYYDQPFFHGFTQRYLQTAPTALTSTITINPGEPGYPGFPNSLDPLTSLTAQPSPRELFLRGDDIRNPYTAQFSLGLQRKLFGDFILTADVIHNLSRKQLQAFNINAPSPFPRTAPGQQRTAREANATRPLTVYLGVPVLDVLVSTNSGNATYDALDLGLAKRFAKRYSLEAHYVYSSAIDSVIDDHLGANPNEWSDIVRAERAQSDFNQRHRFVSYGTVALPFRSQVSAVATLASGLQVNPLTGVDNNGDGRFVDRPAGFGRNSFRGSGHTRFDVSYAKNIALDRIGEATRLELRADLFNLFNNSNFYRFNNNYGDGATPSASFLQPVAGVSNVDPGRQLQLAVRLVF